MDVAMTTRCVTLQGCGSDVMRVTESAYPLHVDNLMGEPLDPHEVRNAEELDNKKRVGDRALQEDGYVQQGASSTCARWWRSYSGSLLGRCQEG